MFRSVLFVLSVVTYFFSLQNRCRLGFDESDEEMLDLLSAALAYPVAAGIHR